jgi:hypothetical protein
MSDTNNGPSESVNHLRGDVALHIQRLSGAQGLHETLLRVLRFAADDGCATQEDIERAVNIRPHLTFAEQEMNSESPDPEQVREHLEDARQAATTFRRECSVPEYSLPGAIYTAGYSVLGGYAEYVEEYIVSTIGRATSGRPK